MNEKINSEKISLKKLVLFIVVTVGIGIFFSAIAFVVIFCDGCEAPFTPSSTPNPEEICLDDPRCIIVKDGDVTTGTIVTEIGKEKVKKLQEMVEEPLIQEALNKSNQKDSAMSEDIRIQIYRMLEEEWTKSTGVTPFMNSIIKNDVSEFLRNNHKISSDGIGHVTFGEHILTNIYGANVAVSIKTDNFDQSQDDWWQIAFRDEDGLPFARECEFDSSAGIFSEDIVIKIMDINTGEFIGILNSATPCDVTKESSEKKTPIEPISLNNITPVGHYKISFLQDLVEHPSIQQILQQSNREFSTMTSEEISKLKIDTEWPPPEVGEPTDFQKLLMENRISYLLREHSVIKTQEFGQMLFPEMILTNAKGITIASTERTFNYIHSEDEWWQIASQNDVLVRHCGPDKSINMNSEDIIIKIFDNRGEFIGILNSATPCDVVLYKPLYFYGDSN